jgi:2'-5' RNA ligase
LGFNGIFVLAEVGGEAGRLIREIQLEFDPKLARTRGHPHVTMAGSSGVGPVSPDTSLKDLSAALAPIAAGTAPLVLEFGAPTRFMQTNIVVLPLDPNGPLRELHDRIARSGLSFARARFTFSPHATLSLYPTLSSEALKRVLAMRVEAPAELSGLSVYHTMDPQPAKKLLELEFAGDA